MGKTGLTSWFSGQESTCQCRRWKRCGFDLLDLPEILPLGRFPGDGNPLQYSSLENSMERRAQWATVHGVTKSLTQWSKHASKQDGKDKMTGVVNLLQKNCLNVHGIQCMYTHISFLLSLALTPPSHLSRSSQGTELSSPCYTTASH